MCLKAEILPCKFAMGFYHKKCSILHNRDLKRPSMVLFEFLGRLHLPVLLLFSHNVFIHILNSFEIPAGTLQSFCVSAMYALNLSFVPAKQDH